MSFINHPQLLEYTDYKIDTLYTPDGYKRLNVKFTKSRLELFSPFKQVGDNTDRGTFFYYVTFVCKVKIFAELSTEYNVTVDFQGMFSYIFLSFRKIK